MQVRRAFVAAFRTPKHQGAAILEVNAQGLLTTTILQENTKAVETASGDLIQRFVQVVLGRATEQRRTFDLLRISNAVVTTLQCSAG